MFNTSLDVLYLIIALAVAVITFFISWLLFYFIMIMRDLYSTVKGFRKKIDILEQILTSLKEKVDHASSYLPLLVSGVTKIVEYFSSKSRHRETSDKNKTDEGDEQDSHQT